IIASVVVGVITPTIPTVESETTSESTTAETPEAPTESAETPEAPTESAETTKSTAAEAAKPAAAEAAKPTAPETSSAAPPMKPATVNPPPPRAWTSYDLAGGPMKVCIVDTGDGMTGDEMIKFINQLSSSGAQQSFTGNYGVGAKIAAATKNAAGV